MIHKERGELVAECTDCGIEEFGGTLGKNQRSKLEIIAYIAGIIDGEGCLALNKNKKGEYSWRARVQVTGAFHPGIFLMLRETWGGSIATASGKQCHKMRANGTPYKPKAVWRLSTRCSVTSFLQDILPFLIEKREQAKLLLEFCLFMTTVKRKHRGFGKGGVKLLGSAYSSEVLVKMRSFAEKMKKMKAVVYDFKREVKGFLST